MARASLHDLIAALRRAYGAPAPPKTTHPFELVLLELVAYLAPDDRREKAFDALRERVGLTPAELQAADPAELVEICKLGGIHAELRAERIGEAAEIILDQFGGDPEFPLRLPLRKAIAALKQFPSIGEPGAEKILLFTRTYPVPALDSNGLRVLARVYFGGEQKSYSATYRAIREAIAEEVSSDCDWLIEMHQLLRRHGQECCTRNRPRCSACPIRGACEYAVNVDESD